MRPPRTLNVFPFGCPAPSPADGGQDQLPCFQLVRPPVAVNRATTSTTLNPALRKKRHATLGGAASRTISFCLYYLRHGFSRVQRGLRTPRRTRKKPGRSTFSRTENIVSIPEQSRPANSGRPNKPMPTHHPKTASGSLAGSSIF